MSVLQRVREKFGNLAGATDKTDKSPLSASSTPSVSSVSAIPGESEKFSADLDRRIRIMADRWKYSPEDLAEALAAAKLNPEGWLSCVLADEESAAKRERAGMRFLS